MYDKNNIFAKIINKEIPSKLIYEDEYMIAFHDIYPVAPIHIIVIPKDPYKNYTDFINTAPNDLQLHFFQKVGKLANDLCNEDFRLCTNNGTMSGQTIFHFHVHIIGGKQLGSL